MSGMEDLNWLITAFTERVPSVANAAVVSSDGLPLAFSSGLATDRVDQLAAVTSSIASLVEGAARLFEGGPVAQTLVTMDRGIEFQQRIGALPFGIVVVRARSNRMQDLGPLVSSIIAALDAIKPGLVRRVGA